MAHPIAFMHHYPAPVSLDARQTFGSMQPRMVALPASSVNSAVATAPKGPKRATSGSKSKKAPQTTPSPTKAPRPLPMSTLNVVSSAPVPLPLAQPIDIRSVPIGPTTMLQSFPRPQPLQPRTSGGSNGSKARSSTNPKKKTTQSAPVYAATVIPAPRVTPAPKKRSASKISNEAPDLNHTVVGFSGQAGVMGNAATPNNTDYAPKTNGLTSKQASQGGAASMPVPLTSMSSFVDPTKQERFLKLNAPEDHQKQKEVKQENNPKESLKKELTRDSKISQKTKRKATSNGAASAPSLKRVGLAPPQWQDGGIETSVISPEPTQPFESYIERHRRWKTRYCWYDEDAPDVLSYRDVHLNVDSDTSKQVCVCQLCNLKVGVTRFANHLETCTRRTARQRGRASANRGSAASVGSNSLMALVSSQGEVSGSDGRASPSSRARANAAASLLQKRTSSSGSSLLQNSKPTKRARTTLSVASKAHAKLQEAQLQGKASALALEAAKKLPEPAYIDERFRCRACSMVGNMDDSTILCDGCDRGYHFKCLHRLGLNVDVLAKGAGATETIEQLRTRLTTSDKPYYCVECLPHLLEEFHGTVDSPVLGLSTSQKVQRGRDFTPAGPLEFFCDFCERQITKSRWRCLVCNNFDACVDCHQRFVDAAERGDEPPSTPLSHVTSPGQSTSVPSSADVKSSSAAEVEAPGQDGEAARAADTPSPRNKKNHNGRHRAQRIAIL